MCEFAVMKMQCINGAIITITNYLSSLVMSKKSQFYHHCYNYCQRKGEVKGMFPRGQFSSGGTYLCEFERRRSTISLCERREESQSKPMKYVVALH